MSTPLPRRVPRARIDPIDDQRRARSLLDAVVTVPLRPETIVVVLDDASRGLAILTVVDAGSPARTVDVVEQLAVPGLCDGEAGALLVATVRPADHSSIDPSDATSDDGDRWFEMCDLADAAGLELVEWFLYEPAGVSCPRDRTGAPPRWPADAARRA
jgi:hypothetical protein